VALPLARPALAAGVALALMETLADYGVGSYFGLTTLSTGIYKAWLVMNDRVAAAQLASVLLVVVALLLALERAQGAHALCAAAGRARSTPLDARALRLQRRLAAVAGPGCVRCPCCSASCCRWHVAGAHDLAGGGVLRGRAAAGALLPVECLPASAGG
jgi:ABC-type Fe3+ transport system permease subunit